MYQEYHTGHAWGSRDDYDLCMDTGKIGVETAALNDNVRLGEFAASSWLLAIASGFILRRDFESIQVKKLCSDILK